jgi:hypothetical protein
VHQLDVSVASGSSWAGSPAMRARPQSMTRQEVCGRYSVDLKWGDVARLQVLACLSPDFIIVEGAVVFCFDQTVPGIAP